MSNIFPHCIVESHRMQNRFCKSKNPLFLAAATTVIAAAAPTKAKHCQIVGAVKILLLLLVQFRNLLDSEDSLKNKRKDIWDHFQTIHDTFKEKILLICIPINEKKFKVKWFNRDFFRFLAVVSCPWRMALFPLTCFSCFSCHPPLFFRSRHGLHNCGSSDTVRCHQWHCRAGRPHLHGTAFI